MELLDQIMSKKLRINDFYHFKILSIIIRKVIIIIIIIIIIITKIIMLMIIIMIMVIIIMLIAFVKERFHNAVEIDILGIFEVYSSLQICPPPKKKKKFQGRNYSGRMI